MTELRLTRIVLGWIGYQLVIHGPWRWTCNPSTKFGEWCLSRSGDWVYRERLP